jgi:bacterial/archaeal transporter family protein
MDYRLLSLLALACWGAWGFATKLVSRNQPSEGVAFWSTLASMLPVTLFALFGGTNRWIRPAPLALVSGLAAGVASVLFYVAIKKGPASVVMPLTGMYIVIPALLGFIFLKEPLTVTHVLGLTCAGLAVFFLTR